VAYGGNNTSGPLDVAAALNAHGGRLDFESETFIAHAFKASHFTRGKDGVPSQIAPPLSADADKGDQDTLVAVAFDTYNQSESGDITQTLCSRGDTPGGNAHLVPAIATHSGVRRLTPTECERLQGFPDGFTDVPRGNKSAADGPRYKALGNSMAVPVVRWIGERIEEASKCK
jgi:DNA (cytosine-5)-methyltransferase 1